MGWEYPVAKSEFWNPLSLTAQFPTLFRTGFIPVYARSQSENDTVEQIGFRVTFLIGDSARSLSGLQDDDNLHRMYRR
jgi:hypothetical protein